MSLTREQKILALRAKDKFNAGEKLSRDEKIALLKARDAGLLGGGAMGGAQGGGASISSAMESEQTFPEYLEETAIDTAVGIQRGATAGVAGKVIPELGKAEMIASERSPTATTAGDIIGTVATGKAVPKILGKALPRVASAVESIFLPKNIPQGLASGVVQGATRSNANPLEEPKEFAKDVGVSTAAATIPAMIFKTARNVMTDPIEQRAAAIGARKKDFAAGSPKDVRQTTTQLKKIGFFDQAKMKWDNSKKKFVRAFGDEAKKIPEKLDDKYLYQAESAIEQLNKENDQFLANKNLDLSDVLFEVRSSLNDLSASDLPDTTVQKASEYIDKWVLENLGYAQGDVISNNIKVPATYLEQLKRDLQSAVKKQYETPADALTSDLANAKMTLAGRIKNLLEAVGGEQYAQNNKIQSALMTAKEDLINKRNAEAARSADIPANQVRRMLEIGADFVGLNPMTRATMKEMGGALQSKVPAAEAVQAFPMSLMDTLRDRSEMRKLRKSGRAPDSVESTELNYNRIKGLMSIPIPRSTDVLLSDQKARNTLISKTYHMISPDAAAILERQFEISSPNQMKAVLQKFMTDNPSLFEEDEYNRVDGVISEDIMKQKAIRDIGKAPISAIQKARLVDGVNNNRRNLTWPKSPQ